MFNFRLLAASTAIVLSLSACTSFTQDVAEGASGGWFSSDDEADAGLAEADSTIPGENDPFPNLGEVPERPETPEIAVSYDKLQSGLVSDNSNAHYSDQALRSQQIPTNAQPKPVVSNVSMMTPLAQPANPPIASSIAQAENGPVYEPATITTPVGSAISASENVIPAEIPAKAPTAKPIVLKSTAALKAEQDMMSASSAAANMTQTADTMSYSYTNENETPATAPTAEPLTPGMPDMLAIHEPTNVGNEVTYVGATLDVPQVEASNEAVAALSANHAEEQANSGTHIATLYYSVGSAVLSRHDKVVLAQVADMYGQKGYGGVIIIGHASIPVSPSVPNPAMVNYKVSLDRAVNIVNTLHVLGVPQEHITMDARGANQPARLGDSFEDHAFNRRAEIYFLK